MFFFLFCQAVLFSDQHPAQCMWDQPGPYWERQHVPSSSNDKLFCNHIEPLSNFVCKISPYILFRKICPCDAMMHVLKDFISLKYSELLTEEISKSN